MALFGKLFHKRQPSTKDDTVEEIPIPEPVKLKPSSFNLNDTLRDVANIVSMDAQDRGISIVYRVNKNVPSKLIGDRYKLSRLLSDLIGNAIDFTDKREDVVVQISRNESNQESVELHFEIMDHGIGISQEVLDATLIPMLRGDKVALAYGIQGNGLQRARDIVHAMHGSIEMKSEPKKGTRVIFHIQLGSPDLKEKRYYRLLDKKGMGLRTLVVDNDMGSAKAVVPMLEYFHHDVTIGNLSDLAHMDQYDIVMISSEYWDETLQKNVLETEKKRPKIVLIESMTHHHHQDESALRFVDWLIYKPFTQQFVFEMLMALYSDALQHSTEVDGAAENVPADGVNHVSQYVEAFLNGTLVKPASSSNGESPCLCWRYAHQIFVATDGLEHCNNDYASFVDALKELIWKYVKADRVIAGKLDEGAFADAEEYLDKMKTTLSELGIYKLACHCDLLQRACSEGHTKDIEALRSALTYVLSQTISSLDEFMDQAKYKIH